MTSVALGDIVDIKGGGTPSKDVAAYWDGDIPWASVKDFKSSEIAETVDHITSLGLANSATNLIPANSILVPTRMAVGKAAINKVPMAINQDLKALTPRHGVELRYLLHALIAKAPDLEKQATGATVKGITLEVLKGLQIPLPPLEEQKRTAAILDQADELRHKRQRSLDLLRQLSQAIFIEMFGDPVLNPKGFEAKPLGEVIDFVGGSQPAKSHFLYEPGPDRVRFVQIRDFRTEKYRTYVPKALAKRPFGKDDVMIGRYGPPVFQIFRGLAGTYNVALMKAKPRRNLSSDFVYYLLQEPRLQSYVVANSERTAGQSGVNLELLEKYPAYVPPLELVDEFSHRIAVLNAKLLASRKAAAQTDALFISLQHRAFRGEL